MRRSEGVDQQTLMGQIMKNVNAALVEQVSGYSNRRVRDVSDRIM
jgi:hypothetical protein